MHIQILKFRYIDQDLPSINNFKNDKVDELFAKISEAQISDRPTTKATVYLGEKTAVLKLSTREHNDSTSYDVRFFNFSINLQIETDAIAVYKIFSEESRVNEGLIFSKSKTSVPN